MSPAPSRARGSVLVLVVWTVALLSIWVAGVGSQVASALRLTSRYEQELRAYYQARGLLRQAADLLRRDPTPSYDGLNERWLDDGGTFYRTTDTGEMLTLTAPATGAETRYGLTDVERRINVNTAPVDVLQRVFMQAGGLVQRDAEALADAVADWRDADQDRRPRGAENFYYQGVSAPYPCQDGPLEHLEELLLVRGMTPELYRLAAPFLTVHGSGGLNINTAGPEVLQTLGLSEVGVEGVVLYRLGEDGAIGTADDHVLTSVGAIEGELSTVLPAEDVNRLVQLLAADVLVVGSTAFEAVVTAQAPGGRAAWRLQCTMTREGRMVEWDEQ